MQAAPDQTDLQRWLNAKRLLLLATRELEALDHVRSWLLNHSSQDELAQKYGLTITRPDRTQYHWANDRRLEVLLEKQQTLKAQVQERQLVFKQQCISGERELDVDFTPARQITVQLNRSSNE